MAQIIAKANPGPQSLFIRCTVEDQLFGGARGGGKSFGCLLKFLVHADKYGANARGIFIRRSTPELDEVQRQFMQYLPSLNAEYKTQSRTWIMPNGASIKMRYLENEKDASRYQGQSLTMAIADEVGAFPDPGPLDLIRGSLRSAEGVPCYFIATGNPGGPGHEWLKKRYIDPAPPMTPFYDAEARIWRVFIPSMLSDNPPLALNDPHYIERIRSATVGQPHLLRAWLEGDWNAAPEGGVIKLAWFNKFKYPPSNPLRIIQSWDTAASAKELSSYWVCTTWTEYEGNYYLIDVFRRQMTYPDGKRMAVSLAQKYNPSAVLIENRSTGSALIPELQESRIIKKHLRYCSIDIFWKRKLETEGGLVFDVESKKHEIRIGNLMTHLTSDSYPTLEVEVKGNTMLSTKRLKFKRC